MKKYLTLIIFLFLTSWAGVQAEDFFSNTPQPDPIKIELLNENQTIQPGQPFWVVIQGNIDEGWHAYWKNPGDTGTPTSIEWVLPPGFTAGPTEWPFPQRFDLNSVIGYGYEGSFWLLTPITPPDHLSKDTPIEISANVEWLVCSESNCVPGTTTATASLSVDSASPKPREDRIELFAKARAHLPKKEWVMQADRKDGLVVLHIQSSENNMSYSGADFFPEQKQAIDPQAEALWSPDTEHPGYYTMTLKEKEGKNNASKALKGVLVLHQPNGKPQDVAVEVNTPLLGENPQDELLSLAEEEQGSEVDMQDPTQVVLNPDTQFDGGVGLALIFAFAGGLLLNLMPCVLPVVSFKILSFVKLAGQSRSITLKHGLAFSFGVILSFWVLAILLLILQAYGRSVGWGFQLQEPLFVAALASLLFIFGLSLFGVFELGASLTAMAGQSSKNSGLTGSFFSGILATVVATPCTGPFLGTAIGFAVTLPAFSALMIFTSLALGMSFPYLLLAAFPPLLRFLPKPGNWMVAFKELMGFAMLATVIWLVWVFGAQTSNFSVAFLLVGFFFLSLGCWMFGKWGTPVQSLFMRRFTYVFVALSFFAGSYIIYSSTSSPFALAADASSKSKAEEWEEFSEERIAALQEQGIPVFVDFTAKWCLICQANHYILSTDAVTEKFEQLGVVKMKADWTRNDKKITEALRKFGRNGVPLYLLYGTNPTEPPVILPQVLTTEIVTGYLNKMSPDIAKE